MTDYYLLAALVNGHSMREGMQFALPNKLAKMPGVVIGKDNQIKLHLKLYSNKIGRKLRMSTSIFVN